MIVISCCGWVSRYHEWVDSISIYWKSRLGIHINFLDALLYYSEIVHCALMLLAFHKKIYLICDEIMNFQIFTQVIPIFFKVKYRRPILRVTSPALGSDYLNLDQSATSIQILRWSRDTLFIKLQLYWDRLIKQGWKKKYYIIFQKFIISSHIK